MNKWFWPKSALLVDMYTSILQCTCTADSKHTVQLNVKHSNNNKNTKQKTKSKQNWKNSTQTWNSPMHIHIHTLESVKNAGVDYFDLQNTIMLFYRNQIRHTQRTCTLYLYNCTPVQLYTHLRETGENQTHGGHGWKAIAPNWPAESEAIGSDDVRCRNYERLQLYVSTGGCRQGEGRTKAPPRASPCSKNDFCKTQS